MDNKNSYSVTQNPFHKLSKGAINTYFILLNKYKGLRQINSLGKDGSFVMTNPEIAKLLNRNAVTAGKAVRDLSRRKLIDLKYIPNGYGEIRKIFVKKIEVLEI